MARILRDGKKFQPWEFDSEEEFERVVVEKSKDLFGNKTLYIDVKKRLGRHTSHNKGVPDGYLLDFSNTKQPQLYFVENELSTHDPYGHITEQLVRFSTAAKTSPIQIRTKLLDVIKKDSGLLGEVEKNLKFTPFSNVDELMNYVMDTSAIKIVVVIDEATADLNDSLTVFRTPPDVVTLKRFSCGDDILYLYEPMREELGDVETASVGEDEFDTIVCPAHEEGFRHAYIENNAWWAVRISQKARDQLRYLAIYEKSPKAVVQHYAEIEKIEPYKDTGKYKLYLRNKSKVQPIPLDERSKGVAPQAPRYTSLSKLRSASKLSDLWK